MYVILFLKDNFSVSDGAPVPEDAVEHEVRKTNREKTNE